MHTLKPLLFTLNALIGVDAAMTHVALVHGAHEQFLPTQNPYIVDSLNAVGAVTTSLSLHWLDTHGHPKAARIIGWSLVAARGAVITRNIIANR